MNTFNQLVNTYKANKRNNMAKQAVSDYVKHFETIAHDVCGATYNRTQEKFSNHNQASLADFMAMSDMITSELEKHGFTHKKMTLRQLQERFKEGNFVPMIYGYHVGGITCLDSTTGAIEQKGYVKVGMTFHPYQIARRYITSLDSQALFSVWCGN